MENVNWLKLRLDQQKAMNAQLQSSKTGINANLLPKNNLANNLVKQTQQNIINDFQREFVNPQQLRMNNLVSIDRSVYIKNVMNLPKNMVELLVMVQNQNQTQNVQKQQANPQQNVQQQNVQQNNPQQNQVNSQQQAVTQQNVQQNIQQNIQQQPNIYVSEQPQFQKQNQPVKEKINQQPQQNQQNQQPKNDVVEQKPVMKADAEQFQQQVNQAKREIPQQNIQQHKQIINNNQQRIAENRQNVMQDKNNINNLPKSQQQPMPMPEESSNGVFSRSAAIIYSAKQQIQNNLLNPHNQLHNEVKNAVRMRHFTEMTQKAPVSEENTEVQFDAQKAQQAMTAEEVANFKQNMAKQLTQNVNLTNVSALLQRNSKMAMNKMITAMSMATSQGMTDVKPLQDTINIINASVSANSSNDAAQTLKNLMLLYLPWLPLQEGVGFDLDIEQDEDTPTSDTYIKIMITTVNYGNLNATVSLVTGNSVDVSIICSENFPKKELLKRLSKEGAQHSMQTAFDFKEQKPQEQLNIQNPKAKVNLSNVNQVNPYLLLMSHAIIRYTIELDATISIGSQPIED